MPRPDTAFNWILGGELKLWLLALVAPAMLIILAAWPPTEAIVAPPAGRNTSWGCGVELADDTVNVRVRIGPPAAGGEPSNLGI